ncbi:hypothetical protein I5F10_14710 [Proteus mirabilis]|nr:hypothetical protein [Proteus mirabilis]MBG6049419.1 hypothetical protein [Proteus mirabilis]
MNQENTDSKFPRNESEKLFFESFKKSCELLKQQEVEKQKTEDESFNKKYFLLKVIFIILYLIAISAFILFAPEGRGVVSLMTAFIIILTIFDLILDIEYFRFPESKQSEKRKIAFFAKAIPIIIPIVVGFTSLLI